MKEEEIINKVAQSGLITINMEDYYPEGQRKEIDIAPWLYEGIILREKDFREHVKEHDWEQYQDCFVSVYCTADAIIPQWAYLLLGIQLEPYARKVIYGSSEMLESILMDEMITKADLSSYTDQRIIIKGCGHLPIPPHAYLSLANRLKPLAKSIMFGEACSTVPIYKRR